MKFRLENGGKKSLYELEVQLENVNKSSFKNWKKFQLDNGRKKHLRIGKKVQLENGNNSKCKMKNRNKSPITYKWK